MNTLALSEIQKGNNAAAIELLTHGLDLDPNNSRYYNHLGIAYAGMGKNSEAIKAFQNATAVDKDNVTYHYNLSRIYQATFNFFDADAAIQKASSIDPERVRYLLDQEAKSKSIKKKYLVENIPSIDQLERQMKPTYSLNKTADALWGMAFGIIQRNMAVYLGLAVLLFIFLLGHIPEEKFTKKCNRCGNEYYAGTTSKSGFPMCLQCHWIETKPKSKMNKVLTSKSEDIRNYRTLSSGKALKLELILPGMGSFIMNKPLKAILRITILSASLILIFTGCTFIHSYIPAGIDYSMELRIFGALMAGLLYLRSYKAPPLKVGV